jgi:predicted MFS family arabinose efflux permease
MAARTVGPLAGLVALTSAYVLSQFFRTALGVVAPEIARDLGLEPARLGILSAAWFLAFAAAQIPVGVALDRWGPRRTVGFMFLTAAAGCLLLASAPGLGVAVVGQALIGIGCAPVFMGTLVVLARWYPPGRFATLGSLVLAGGNAGTLLGTTPLAVAAQTLGWRGAFLAFAVLVLLAAAFVLALVRDAPPDAGAREGGTEQRLDQALRDVGRVASNRRLWPLLPISFAAYAVLVTVRGLWGGPYLAGVFGLDPVARGNTLLLMSLAMIAGTLLYAALERRLDRRRELVLGGSVVAILALAALAAAPAASLALAAALLVVLGAADTTYALVMAQGRRFMADAEVGRGLTLLNGACFLGAAVLQWLSGLVVGAAQGAGLEPAATYRWLFGFLAVYFAVALVTYLPSQDRRLGPAARTSR